MLLAQKPPINVRSMFFVRQVSSTEQEQKPRHSERNRPCTNNSSQRERDTTAVPRRGSDDFGCIAVRLFEGTYKQHQSKKYAKRAALKSGSVVFRPLLGDTHRRQTAAEAKSRKGVEVFSWGVLSLARALTT